MFACRCSSKLRRRPTVGSNCPAGVASLKNGQLTLRSTRLTKPKVAFMNRTGATFLKGLVGTFRLGPFGLITTAFLLSNSPALAQDLYVTGLTSRSLEVVDRESLRWRSGHPEVDYILIHRTPIAVVNGSHFEWQQRAELKIQFDCDRRVRKILSATMFSYENEVIYEVGPVDVWLDSETVGDSITIALVCDNEAPRSLQRFDNLYRLMASFYDALSSGQLEHGLSGWRSGNH